MYDIVEEIYVSVTKIEIPDNIISVMNNKGRVFTRPLLLLKTT